MSSSLQSPARGASGRVIGVDLARAVAVVGMMAVHVLPGEDVPGAAGVLYAIAHGRASGLFAVLAGVSLGLTTRRSWPGTGPERLAARVAVVVRGLLVALLGLLLVDAGSRIAIILPYYGVAFVVVLPFLWWPARRLVALAVGWLALAPLASFALREVYGLPAQYEQPTLHWLARPGTLLETLTLTGYYPVIGWAGYLVLGLGVSRVDLRGSTGPLRVLGAGAVLAALAWMAGTLAGPAAGTPLPEFYGTVPTDSWRWLTVVAPHSGTPFDLLHTAGTALVAIGALCLVPPALARFLQPVAALGSMPLTVYTLHVLALAAHPGDSPQLLALHVAAAVVFATAWRTFLPRGPLEAVVGGAARGGYLAVLRFAPGGAIRHRE